jgi:hypothetical protein
MARYNEILVGRYNRFCQKLFAMKGEAVAPQLGNEITPVWLFFNGAENRYLEGWDRFGVWQQQANVAAQTSAAQLRNPTGSNVVAVVEKVVVVPSLADQPQLSHGPQGADLGTVDTATFARWDPRGRTNPSLIFSRANNVTGIANTKAQLGLAAQTSGDFIITDIQEVTLLPGDALRVNSIAVNLTLSVAWWWRERALEESERF